ncbi:LacI family DNA-binding transcriptional regulator [Pseudomonas baetica]|uniref:LacI family DNA-binding transcriptional regulator n=1 Tax=Pseudomonas baetica TaxID=674054 RepID=UPI003EEFFEBD
MNNLNGERRVYTDEGALQEQQSEAASDQPLLSDVARFAGVSTATVSRFLNDPKKLSERTRAKVQAAIEQLNWVPNAAARSLVSRKSYAVGAIIPTLEHEKFHQQLQAFQARLGKAGFSVFVACSSYDPLEGDRQARAMISRGVDALALVGDDYPDALFDLLNSKHIPYVVTFGRRVGSEHPCIGFEHGYAYERMTQRLVDLGHKRFGVIFQSSHQNSRVQARLQAINETLANNGLAVRSQHSAVMADDSMKGIPFARAEFNRIMKTKPAPTAFICGNDMLAVGALLEAQAMGIDVPGKVSITGFDDIQLASQLSPMLTTMSVPDRQIGELAAEYLLKKMAGEKAQCPPMLEVSIVERESTGIAPTES